MYKFVHAVRTQWKIAENPVVQNHTFLAACAYLLSIQGVRMKWKHGNTMHTLVALVVITT